MLEWHGNDLLQSLQTQTTQALEEAARWVVERYNQRMQREVLVVQRSGNGVGIVTRPNRYTPGIPPKVSKELLHELLAEIAPVLSKQIQVNYD